MCAIVMFINNLDNTNNRQAYFFELLAKMIRHYEESRTLQFFDYNSESTYIGSHIAS